MREPDGYMVRWTEKGIRCSRVFQFEDDAMQWAAGLDSHSLYGTCENIEVVEMFVRDADQPEARTRGVDKA